MSDALCCCRSDIEDEVSEKDAVTKKAHLSSTSEEDSAPAIVTGDCPDTKKAESNRTHTTSSGSSLLGLAAYSSSDSSDDD